MPFRHRTPLPRLPQTGRVIADVDQTVAAWLGRFVPKTKVVFTPPPDSTSSSAKRSPSVLAVVLCDIREEPAAGEPGWSSMRDATGVTIGRRAPSRTYRLTYLLLACGRDPLEEHRVLGQVLAGSLLDEVVADDLLAGRLSTIDGVVTARCAPHQGTVDTRWLWPAWGIHPRATLELSVVAPMPQDLVVEVALPPSSVDLGVGRLPPVRRSAEVNGDPPRRPEARITED